MAPRVGGYARSVPTVECSWRRLIVARWSSRAALWRALRRRYAWRRVMRPRYAESLCIAPPATARSLAFALGNTTAHDSVGMRRSKSRGNSHSLDLPVVAFRSVPGDAAGADVPRCARIRAPMSAASPTSRQGVFPCDCRPSPPTSAPPSCYPPVIRTRAPRRLQTQRPCWSRRTCRSPPTGIPWSPRRSPMRRAKQCRHIPRRLHPAIPPVCRLAPAGCSRPSQPARRRSRPIRWPQ